MKLVLVGLYCGPLLTLIPPLTRTQAKNHGRGNRVGDFRVSGGPHSVLVKIMFIQSEVDCKSLLKYVYM